MAEGTPIPPDLFARMMQEIAKRADAGDETQAHIAADETMCRLLKALGYSEGVEIFEKMSKWYE